MSTSEPLPREESSEGEGVLELVASVRLAGPNDVKSIMEISKSAGYTNEKEKDVKATLADRLVTTFLATVNGSPVGFYRYRRTGNLLILGALREAGGGYGKHCGTLVLHFRDRLLGKDCNKILRAILDEKNVTGCAFFREFGFKATGVKIGKVYTEYRIGGPRNRLKYYLEQKGK